VDRDQRVATNHGLSIGLLVGLSLRLH